jgi:hypothetical protein
MKNQHKNNALEPIWASILSRADTYNGGKHE